MFVLIVMFESMLGLYIEAIPSQKNANQIMSQIQAFLINVDAIASAMPRMITTEIC